MCVVLLACRRPQVGPATTRNQMASENIGSMTSVLCCARSLEELPWCRFEARYHKPGGIRPGRANDACIVCFPSQGDHGDCFFIITRSLDRGGASVLCGAARVLTAAGQGH
jgi:hypothetical protein